MNLSFSTKWENGKPNFFIEKIWSGLTKESDLVMYISHDKYFKNYFEKFGLGLSSEQFHPKIHTLREDKKDRWKEGNLIHPIINNRTANRFQFAPTMSCHSIQNVILYNNSEFKGISIDDCILYHSDGDRDDGGMGYLDLTIEFVKNDGFDNIDSFFNYFCPNNSIGVKKLKLIHWTPLKY